MMLRHRPRTWPARVADRASFAFPFTPHFDSRTPLCGAPALSDGRPTFLPLPFSRAHVFCPGRLLPYRGAGVERRAGRAAHVQRARGVHRARAPRRRPNERARRHVPPHAHQAPPDPHQPVPRVHHHHHRLDPPLRHGPVPPRGAQPEHLSRAGDHGLRRRAHGQRRGALPPAQRVDVRAPAARGRPAARAAAVAADRLPDARAVRGVRRVGRRGRRRRAQRPEERVALPGRRVLLHHRAQRVHDEHVHRDRALPPRRHVLRSAHRDRDDQEHPRAPQDRRRARRHARHAVRAARVRVRRVPRARLHPDDPEHHPREPRAGRVRRDRAGVLRAPLRHAGRRVARVARALRARARRARTAHQRRQSARQKHGGGRAEPAALPNEQGARAEPVGGEHDFYPRIVPHGVHA